MMKKLSIFFRLAVFIALAFSLSGCDFFRSLAGRPTSSDIEEMKTQIELERIVAAQADSANAERIRQERIRACLDSLYGSGVPMYPLEKIRNLSYEQLSYRYYIMIGTFSSEDNARRLAASASDAGYPAVILAYANGKSSVALCPSDSPEEIYQSLNQVRDEAFCPSDVWILVRE